MPAISAAGVLLDQVLIVVLKLGVNELTMN